MENEERKVFIDKLPVSEPVPVAKPNKNIQLAPIVQPMAVVPFVSFDGDDVDVKVQKTHTAEPETAPVYNEPEYQEPQPQYYQEPQYDQYNRPAYYAPKGYGNEVKQYGQYKKKKKKSGKGPNRLGALFSMIFTLIALAPFVLVYEGFGLASSLPEFLQETPDIINYVINLIDSISNNVISVQDIFTGDMLGSTLLALGLVVLAINFLVSFIALLAGSRPNYVVMAIIVMLLLIFGICFYTAAMDGKGPNDLVSWVQEYFGSQDFLKDNWFLVTAVDGIAFLFLEIIAFAIGSKNQYIED